MSYNRDNVVSYAKQYAYNYNPNYIDYATYEGSSDCANFVSQCLYAGGIAMTDTWYYRYPGYSSPSVSTAWRGAQSLRRFVQSLDVVTLSLRWIAAPVPNPSVTPIMRSLYPAM